VLLSSRLRPSSRRARPPRRRFGLPQAAHVDLEDCARSSAGASLPRSTRRTASTSGTGTARVLPRSAGAATAR